MAYAPINRRNQPNNPGSEVGLFGGHFIPLDRTDNPANAQRLGGALHHAVQPDGSGDHRAHGLDPAAHDAHDPEAVEADAGHEFATAEDQGDSGQVLQGPDPGLPGDHAPLQGSRGQPPRLPGPYDHPDAGADRPLPGIDPDGILQARRLGRTVGEDVRLDTNGADLRSGAIGFQIPLAGPGAVRPHQPDYASACLRLDLGPAEDDDATVDRPAAVGQSSHDALADAPDDRVLLVHATQRTGPLLGNFQPDRYRDPIFRNWWLGTIVPAIPQSRAGSRAGRGNSAIPR